MGVRENHTAVPRMIPGEYPHAADASEINRDAYGIIKANPRRVLAAPTLLVEVPFQFKWWLKGYSDELGTSSMELQSNNA